MIREVSKWNAKITYQFWFIGNNDKMEKLNFDLHFGKIIGVQLNRWNITCKSLRIWKKEQNILFSNNKI